MNINNLQKLYQLGQSPWYDNIERGLITNGELKKLFNQGILGITTNPSIFEKAINTGSYDNDISYLKTKNKSALEIYDELTLQDVAWAADALLDVYEKSWHQDGYVSLEVLPEYAHNEEKTLEDAERLFSALNRKNIMIKIPATEEGLRAIRKLIAQGININITLIFSITQYEDSQMAYIQGLQDRINKGKSLKDINSVASVFISRIDTYIDEEFNKMFNKESDPNKKMIIKELTGNIAVANTKLIYAKYKELFSDKHFSLIKAKGGNVQRILWGSTSTKNSSYSDVKYVDELIGQGSINTIPHNTLMAFIDHGNPSLTIEQNIEGAREKLGKLKELDIDIETVCRKIHNDGIKAFQDAFIGLINSVQNKIK
ncbi:MAG: transaldolase [Candidatus Firestonebacteria bacterium]|nr:transaldolase [Candidatus Firestonebacteria bacterium]